MEKKEPDSLNQFIQWFLVAIFSHVFLFLFVNYRVKLFVPSCMSYCLCFYYADLSKRQNHAKMRVGGCLP